MAASVTTWIARAGTEHVADLAESREALRLASIELEQLGQLPERYYILDLSAELCERQWQTLQRDARHLLTHVEWLDATPNGFTGIVLLVWPELTHPAGAGVLAGVLSTQLWHQQYIDSKIADVPKV